jgi:excinuclease ABC subunit C
VSASAQFENAGPVPGLAVSRDRDGTVIFVWLSASLEADASRFGDSSSGVDRRLADGAASVEIEADFASAAALVARFVSLLGEHRPPGNIFIGDEPSYPHVKITASERFPRALVTRRVRGDGARYFGPFLPETAVRHLIDLTRGLFRLRTCTVDVDGSESTPCSEHGLNRCLAPCVSALCDDATYARAVEDVQMLLSGQAFELAGILDTRMEEAAAAFEFEAAARWRDLRAALSDLAGDLRVRPDLSSVTDLLVVKQTDDGHLAAQLMTTEGGHVIGRRTFVYSLSDAMFAQSEEWMTTQLLAQLHGLYVPGRIALPIVTGRIELVVRALSERVGRDVELIRETGEARPTRLRLAEREAAKLLVERIAADRADVAGAALTELAEALGLPANPRRIEALDVAHLSGRTMTAALVIGVDGRRLDSEDAAWIVDAGVEVDALSQAVIDRLSVSEWPMPELVLVVGGKAQLDAVAGTLASHGHDEIPVVAMTKPRGRSREVNHVLRFVAREGEPQRVELPARSAALRLAIRLRDDAHHAANGAHRYHREFVTLARRAGSQQVVPVRLDDPDGDAADLRPILKLDRAGRDLLAKRLPPMPTRKR